MKIDVSTLYVLIVGTTFVGAALTVWQCRTASAQRQEMALWAAGHSVIGLGCLFRLLHESLPPFVCIGLSNLAVVAGYAAITAGTIRFAGKRVSLIFFAAAGSFALGWLAWAQYAPLETRIVVTALPVAALSFQAALALRGRGSSALVALRLVRTMLALHGLFFLGRAGVTLSGIEGEIRFDGPNFAATMLEGVLWSAFAPAALLMMAREATERRLIAASETDFLTGVANRRAFMGKAANLLGDSVASASVVLFDLDHFKAINDRHGHAIGDEILQAFCRVTERELSPGDVFGRLGGEEFAAVFHDCGAGDARSLAVAISKLYTAEVALRFSLSLDATASAGIAEWRPGADLDRLLGEADAALYRAKQAGRDQVVIAEAPVAAPAAPPETRAA